MSLRIYLRERLRDRADPWILIATALLLLVLSEPLLMAALERFTPAWFDHASQVPTSPRRLCVGLPAAFALLWLDWRRWQRAP